MPPAVTNVFRPPSELIIPTALPASVLKAVPSWPSVMSLITPSDVVDTVPRLVPVAVVVVLPALRYEAIANPDAIPVTLGCGIDFFMDLLDLFLRTYARLEVFLIWPFRVERFRDVDAS